MHNLLLLETEVLGMHNLRQLTIRKAAVWMLVPVSLTLFYFYPVKNSFAGTSFLILFFLDMWLLLVVLIKKYFNAVAIVGLFVFYAGGVLSIFMKGVGDMGSVLLFSLPVAAGYLLGFRWAFICICANLLSLLAFRYMHINWLTLWRQSPLSWDSYIIHFTLLSGVFSLSVSAIMRVLEGSLSRERSVSAALELEGLELIRANVQLEREVDEKTRIQEALSESEEKFRTMIEQSREVIVIISLEGTITFASRSVETTFGVEPGFISGKNALDFVHPDDREELINVTGHSIRAGVEFFSLRYRNMDKNGMWLTLEATCSNLLDNPLINGLLLNIRNITEQEKALERARYLEDYDSLTQLPNREMFMKKLRSEITRSSRQEKLFAVLFVNIDRFKEVNEMYGPMIGDRILRQIADRLASICFSDDFVARLAGDVFGILLPDVTTYDDAIEIVDKTRRIIADPLAEGDAFLKLTASLGVCLYPNDGDTDEMLIRNCESALHVAKVGGRNIYHFFDQKVHEDLVRRIQLEKEIERAIARDEFEVYYQPRVSHNGRIIGMEALMRWISPKLGVVSPLEFIPIAEASGFIIDIGYIILRRACRQTRLWQEKGFGDLVLSVNLSPFQFRNRNLVYDIDRIASSEGLAPYLLELEITESGIMEDEEDALDKLHLIHEMGMRISIDDFGTGYSSLSKLKTYPVDTLKIDRSFVVDIPSDPMSLKITNSIIALAHNLGFEVVAEGVERKEQVDFFVSHGCDQFQGYHFFPPLPAADFERLLVGQSAGTSFADNGFYSVDGIKKKTGDYTGPS